MFWELFQSTTTKIILEIGDLNNEKERDEKRREKLKVRKEELVEDVKGDVGWIGGEVC